MIVNESTLGILSHALSRPSILGAFTSAYSQWCCDVPCRPILILQQFMFGQRWVYLPVIVSRVCTVDMY